MVITGAFVCVCKVRFVPSFSDVTFCAFVSCLQGTEPEQEEETCALTNDANVRTVLAGERRHIEVCFASQTTASDTADHL